MMMMMISPTLNPGEMEKTKNSCTLQGKEHLVNVGFTYFELYSFGFNTKLDYITFIDTNHL